MRLCFILCFLIPSLSARADELLDPSQSFFTALSEGKLYKIKEALKENPELAKAKDSNGDPAIISILHNSFWDNLQPISEAIMLDIIDELTNYGANVDSVNTKGTPALILALSFKFSIVKKLLEKGADINLSDNEGETPLLQAMFEEDQKLIDHLLSWSNINVHKTNNKGISPLIRAAQMANFVAVQNLLKKGANPNARNNDRETALMRAVLPGEDTKTINELIRYGADINLADLEGNTALALAVKNRDESAVQILLKNGADPNSKDKNKQPILIAAVTHGASSRIIKNLIDNPKTNIDITDQNKRTALMWASWMGRKKAIKILIRGGAKTDLKSLNGLTANDYAQWEVKYALKEDQSFIQKIKKNCREIWAKL